jgi:hypothetical protein
MHQFVAAPDVRTLVPDLPQPLAQVVMRALAKNPDERFGSMQEFAVALGPFAVQGVHTLPHGQGVTQLSVPPGIANASTYASSRGQVSAPPKPPSRALTWVLGALTVLSLTALVVVATRRSASTTEVADASVPFEAGDRAAMLKVTTKKAIEKRDWLAAQIAVQKWMDIANDAEAQETSRKIGDETAAERAFTDLTTAANEKRHLDGQAAFDRIPASSVYRDQAIEAMARLRRDYIAKKAKIARELAAGHRCKELADLQVEAQRLGPDALNSVQSGIACIQAP